MDLNLIGQFFLLEVNHISLASMFDSLLRTYFFQLSSFYSLTIKHHNTNTKERRQREKKVKCVWIFSRISYSTNRVKCCQRLPKRHKREEKRILYRRKRSLIAIKYLRFSREKISAETRHERVQYFLVPVSIRETF
jgi:hypothetical protein